MYYKSSLITFISSCLLATQVNAATFDGSTNSIPDNASYTGLIVGEDLPNTFVTLNASNSASVSSYVFVGNNDSSTNNTLLIEDNATLLIGEVASPSTNGVFIGKSVGEVINIDNASRMEASALAMNSDSGQETSIVASGEGSELIINGDVSIGTEADNNIVKLNRGSSLQVGGQLNVGEADTENNKIQVANGGTLVVDSLDKISIAENNSISMSGVLETGGDVDIIKIGDTKVTFNNGSSVQVNDNFIGSVEGGYSIDLNDTATWTTESNTAATVGFNSSGSTLSVINNSALTLSDGLVVGGSGKSNKFNVKDEAEVTVSNIVIGNKNTGNQVNISSNGTLNVTSSGIILGNNAAANANILTISDFGTLNASNIVLGVKGSNNDFIMTGGSATIAGNFTVGATEGSDGNEINISGSNAVLSVIGNLNIGQTNNANNKVKLSDGGTLEIDQNSINILGENNNIFVNDEGILKTLGWDFNAMTNGGSSNVVFNSGSILQSTGVITGTNTIDGKRTFVLDGAGASWDVGTNIVYIGSTSHFNSLTITNGAQVNASTSLYIGSSTSSGNKLMISGSNSALSVASDLFVGETTYTDADNILSLMNGATNIVVEGNVHLYDGILEIDSTSQMTVKGDYEQDENSTFKIGVSSNEAPPSLIIEGEAKFASNENSDNHTISVFDEGINESNEVKIVQAGGIYLDDEQLFDGSILGTIATNDLLNFTASITNEYGLYYIVLNNFIKHTAGDYLEGQLLDVYNEIIDLSTNPSNSAAVAMEEIIRTELTTEEEINAAFETYYGKEQSSIPAHNVINMGIQSVADQLTMRADTTRSRMGSASAAVNFEKPQGAEGPHEAGQELQGWINGYGTWGSQDASDGFSSYDADVTGFMVGADFSVAENILLGIAGGKGNGTIDKNTGTKTDTDSIHAALYGSMGTEEWFVDGSFIYGTTDVDTRMGSTFDTTSDFTAQNFAFYVGGGKEMKTDYLIITPQLSMLANSYAQDGYTEEASNAVGRDIDSFEAFYLQSSLGCSIGMYMGSEEFTFKPEIRAYWQHEWLGDDETINYQLIDGTGSYQLALQAPEKDILKIGIGSAFHLGELLEIRADFDTRQSKNYSDFTLLGSLRYQF